MDVDVQKLNRNCLLFCLIISSFFSISYNILKLLSILIHGILGMSLALL